MHQNRSEPCLFEAVGLGVDDCPLGYACTCVPSCPVCDDCAAQVCVRDPSRECATACDCPTGLGCFEGQCLAGFAPVYCCDSDVCPAGEQCQHRDGGMDRCGPIDPMCRERVEKISRAVDHLVERGSRCHADSDCVQINTGTGCAGTCGAYVHRRLAPHIEKRIRHLDHQICSGFIEDGCPYLTPLCLPTVGACFENRCVGLVWQVPIPLPVASAPTGDGR